MNPIYSEQPFRRSAIRENLLLSDTNVVPHRAMNLINVLGWAASKNIPLHEAVSAITPLKATYKADVGADTVKRNMILITFQGVKKLSREERAPWREIQFATGVKPIPATTQKKTSFVITFKGIKRVSYDVTPGEKIYHRSKPRTLDEKFACVAEDLRNGQQLSDSLERWLANDMPKYLFDEVREAENKNQLAAALPNLASSLAFTSNVKLMRQTALTFPMVYVPAILLVTFFLMIFIMPKYNKIMQDLSYPHACSLAIPTQILFAIAHSSLDQYASFLLIGLGIVSIFSALYFRPRLMSILLLAWLLDVVVLRVFERAIEPCDIFLGVVLVFISLWVFFVLMYSLIQLLFAFISWSRRNTVVSLLSKIPFLGRSARRAALFETAGAMASFLRAGKDVADALELSAKATSHEWIRWPLAEVAIKIRNGEKWTQAWEASGIGSPFQNWLLRNAEANGDVANGFNRIAEMSRYEMTRATKVHIYLVEFAALAFNAAVVGIVFLGVGSALSNALKALMESF